MANGEAGDIGVKLSNRTTTTKTTTTTTMTPRATRRCGVYVCHMSQEDEDFIRFPCSKKSITARISQSVRKKSTNARKRRS